MKPQTIIIEKTIGGITIKASHTNGLNQTYFIIDVLSPALSGCRSLRCLNSTNEERAGEIYRSLVAQAESGIEFWGLKFVKDPAPIIHAHLMPLTPEGF